MFVLQRSNYTSQLTSHKLPLISPTRQRDVEKPTTQQTQIENSNCSSLNTVFPCESPGIKDACLDSIGSVPLHLLHFVSMELGLHAPIPHPVHPELKHQACALNPHVQRKVQIIKLDAFGRCQPRKQTPWHAVQIRRKCAHVDQTLAIRVGRCVHIAGDQVVLDNERLARPKIARVVE